MVAGAGDMHSKANVFVHGDSPQTGRAWEAASAAAASGEEAAVAFDKLKLTNNRGQPTCPGQLCLHSMHKYQPVVHVRKVNEEEDDDDDLTEKSITFAFPETVFTTVTAYQNQQVSSFNSLKS